MPVIVDTASGRFVTKLRGAAQGILVLIAEIIVAELAEALGLPVPERVLITLDPGVPSDDRNDELADLLAASTGTNLGFRYLEGAIELGTRELALVEDAFAARLLWLDWLVMNPDRTPENPNLLLWKGQPWLIDHGAALPFQHDWRGLSEASPRVPWDPGQHLFAQKVSLLARYDSELSAALPRERLAAAVEAVPEEFLRSAFPNEDAFRLRQSYQAFLWKRLKPPRPYVPLG